MVAAAAVAEEVTARATTSVTTATVTGAEITRSTRLSIVGQSIDQTTFNEVYTNAGHPFQSEQTSHCYFIRLLVHLFRSTPHTSLQFHPLLLDYIVETEFLSLSLSLYLVRFFILFSSVLSLSVFFLFCFVFLTMDRCWIR